MILTLRPIRWTAAVAGLYLLEACSSTAMPIMNLAEGIVAQQRSVAAGVAIPDLPNPAYRYLRVEVQGRSPALLVLGYLDQGPLGEVEVWYSARREVIRTIEGRVVGTAGLEVDWRAVRYPKAPPQWNSDLRAELEFERTRDVMPGYRFGISERLALSAVDSAPAGTLATRLPQTLSWYVERVIGSQLAEVPPAVYAIARIGGKRAVLYSRQCLSADFCLHLQPWPVPAVDP